MNKTLSIAILLVLTAGTTVWATPLKGFSRANRRVLRRARRQKRTVVLNFGADWCPWSKKLERDTLVQPDVQTALKSFRTLKVDMTKPGPEETFIAERFGIRTVPTIVFLDQEGKELTESRQLGFLSPEAFLELLERLRPTSE